MKYGDRVDIVRKLVRHQKYLGPNARDKFWKEAEYFAKNCIFLGYRTVADGFRGYDPEEGYNFFPKKHFRVALISPGERLSPIYCPISAVTKSA